jgi:hypothetical protein
MHHVVDVAKCSRERCFVFESALHPFVGDVLKMS